MIMNITVNELLLRERQEFSCFSKVGTFDSSNGGESPACAAMYLILYWGNTTFLNPAKRMVLPRPVNGIYDFELVKDINV